MARTSPQIEIARVYDAPAASRRYRVLVDRLWPRGVKREDLAFDEWPKEIAPSDDLRKWFGHDAARWDKFRDRYFKELAAHSELIDHLLAMAKQQGLLLLFAARDVEHNNAVALREYLLAGGKKTAQKATKSSTKISTKKAAKKPAKEAARKPAKKSAKRSA